MKYASTRQRQILNGYRAAAAQTADALALHKARGNTAETLIAYRIAAITMAAAYKLDQEHTK